jgi:hypothetical protein
LENSIELRKNRFVRKNSSNVSMENAVTNPKNKNVNWKIANVRL